MKNLLFRYKISESIFYKYKFMLNLSEFLSICFMDSALTEPVFKK